jgi:hypothetical protein
MLHSGQQTLNAEFVLAFRLLGISEQQFFSVLSAGGCRTTWGLRLFGVLGQQFTLWSFELQHISVFLLESTSQHEADSDDDLKI